jgi:RNA polymerase sigma factor (sigma-70 family)
MPPRAQQSRPDVAALSDEDLVRLARGDDSQAALRELIARHYAAMEISLGYWARTWRLSDADREDALLQAVLGLQEALAKYNTESPAEHEVGRFRSFLVRIVWHRFVNCARAARRREHHIDRSVHVEDLPDRTVGPLGTSCAGDPSGLVVLFELRVQLAAALSQLAGRAQGKGEMLVANQRLQEVADALGLTYRQAKRLRHRVRDQLANLLKDWNDLAR